MASDENLRTILTQLEAAYKELLVRSWRARNVAKFYEAMDRLEAVIDLNDKLARRRTRP